MLMLVMKQFFALSIILHRVNLYFELIARYYELVCLCEGSQRKDPDIKLQAKFCRGENITNNHYLVLFSHPHF